MVVTSTLAVTGVAAIVELLARTGSPEQAYQLPTVQIQSTSQTTSGDPDAAGLHAFRVRPHRALERPERQEVGLLHTTPPMEARSSSTSTGPGRHSAPSARTPPAPSSMAEGRPSFCPCHGATFSTGDGSVTRRPRTLRSPRVRSAGLGRGCVRDHCRGSTRSNRVVQSMSRRGPDNLKRH